MKRLSPFRELPGADLFFGRNDLRLSVRLIERFLGSVSSTYSKPSSIEIGTFGPFRFSISLLRISRISGPTQVSTT